jgi:uncharacterized repeat protein (TIGR03843 family)
MSSDATPDAVTNFDAMIDGEITVEGRMPWSSNATFLVQLSAPGSDEVALRAIYKPLKGERPLWDYPTGLWRREVAASELSAFLGWDAIPRTVAREGPYGIGSMQRFVDADFEHHYFTIRETLIADRPMLDLQMRRLATFDLLANSGDRKSGHVLVEGLGDDPQCALPSIYGIDNGLSFHDEHKLRTVMWDYVGEPIDDELLTDVERLIEASPNDLARLSELLSADEMHALIERANDVLLSPVFPQPWSNHAYPWPMV